MTRTVPITPEWAVWGKDEGERGYGLQECSRGRLQRSDFEQIMRRYSMGTHTDLPQVMITWSRLDSGFVIGLAVQDWTSGADRLGRRVAATRYFGVPYEQLTHPVSYEDLYVVLSEHDPRGNAPLLVPVLDPARLAAQVDDLAVGTAALVLQGRPDRVQIVGAEGEDTRTRLRFLDTVAALLPFGLRTRLSAATWVSSTADHNFRLSFSRHAADDVQRVTWGEQPPFPRYDPYAQETDADRYMRLLAQCDDYEQVVAGFARELHPLDFKGGGTPTLAALETLGGSVAAPPVAAAQPRTEDPAAVLNACADAVDVRDQVALEAALNRLRYLTGLRYGHDKRAEFRWIARTRRLLVAPMPYRDGPPIEAAYADLVRFVYGTALTVEHLDEIQDDAGAVNTSLLKALFGVAGGQNAVRLLVAMRLGAEHVRTALDDLHNETLAAVADRHADVPGLVSTACREFIDRAKRGQPVDEPLVRRGFLAAALDICLPDQMSEQYAWLRELLMACYGPQLHHSQFMTVVNGAHAFRRTPALLLAGAALYPDPHAGDHLLEGFLIAVLGEQGFDKATVRLLEGRLRPPRPALGEPAQPQEADASERGRLAKLNPFHRSASRDPNATAPDGLEPTRDTLFGPGNQ